MTRIRIRTLPGPGRSQATMLEGHLLGGATVRDLFTALHETGYAVDELEDDSGSPTNSGSSSESKKKTHSRKAKAKAG